MIGDPNRSGLRTFKVAGALGVVFILAFVAGVWHEAGRVAALAAVCTEASRTTRERARQIRDWEGASRRERALWGAIRRAYTETVPVGELRLAVPGELTDLAARCGLGDVNLTEMTPEELRFTHMDVFEGGSGHWMPGETARSQGMSAFGGAQGTGHDLDLEEFGFRMHFRASFGALAEFLRGLQNTKSMIVARKVVIRRGLPALQVEMIMAAYRRKP